ncbi:MAG: dimethyl sulfoxide reductase anchor subunit [Coriobacteriales bacterium]|jgi:anaerobic dimethyl sulfoxide reductase subunit C (anchor subunit)|nr:dimethyl sulfoxide reductase anchor subunit [Coriobacteriales bacterium]
MAIQWTLVLFTLLAGSGAGLLAFAGFGEFFNTEKKTRFVSIIVALILLVVGGIFSILHLGHPSNVMSAAANLGSFSPISLELIFLILTALVALIYLFVVNRNGAAGKVLGVLGILVGIAFMYVSGHGYEVITARPAWNNPMLSLSYLMTSLTLGGFLFLMFMAIFKDEEAALKRISIVVLIVAILETIALVIYGAMAQAHLAAGMLPFWIGAMAIGGAIAALLAIVVVVKKSKPMIYIGVLAVLAGGICFRVAMWLAGSAFLPNLFDISAHSRGLFPF